MSGSNSLNNSRHTLDNSFQHERDYEGSIKRQIQKEELRFKEAIQADKNFEEVKAIRVKINDLKRLKEKISVRKSDK